MVDLFYIKSNIYFFLFKENETVVENFDEIAEKMKSKDSKGISAIFQGFVAFLSKSYISAIHLCNKGMIKHIITFINVRIIGLSRECLLYFYE